MIGVTEELPRIELRFKCAVTERNAIVIVPLHCGRCVEVMNVSTAQLREKWMSVIAPELRCSLIASIPPGESGETQLDLAFRRSIGLGLFLLDADQYGTIGCYRCIGGVIGI
jgi:hypothetical protein